MPPVNGGVKLCCPSSNVIKGPSTDCATVTGSNPAAHGHRKRQPTQRSAAPGIVESLGMVYKCHYPSYVVRPR